MAFETQVKEGGAWRTGLLVSGYDGGAWRDIQEIWAREAGAWRQVYVRSDPVATTISGYWSQAYAEDSHQIDYTFSDEDLIQGDWDTVGHTHGTQRGTGLCHFRQTDIQAPFGARTVVQACTFNAICKSQYTSNGIYMRGDLRSGTTTSVPSTWSHTHGDYANTDADRVNPGETGTISPGAAGGQQLFDGNRTAVQTHEWADGTDSASKEYYRGSWYGVGNGVEVDPYLAMTVDYI